ncbi:MAG: fluoride efflux transporter CrcB [Planctomycetota bacterium]|nr:fluoride efflux transporter CrcB [Planctomycetota bacterium]
MSNLLFVGLGGFLGAVGRHGLSGLTQRLAGSPWFPVGTLTVNVLGCLCIGLLGGLAEVRGAFTPERQAFLLTGLLGGFTTFSAFGYETVELLRVGQTGSAVLNVALQLGVGFAAVWLGLALGRHV